MAMSNDGTKKKPGQRREKTGKVDKFTMFGDRCLKPSKSCSMVSRANV